MILNKFKRLLIWASGGLSESDYKTDEIVSKQIIYGAINIILCFFIGVCSYFYLEFNDTTELGHKIFMHIGGAFGISVVAFMILRVFFSFHGSLHTFFWWCSGANIEILKEEDCKAEHSKYFGIGGTVFFTALMAAIAGGYAFYMAIMGETTDTGSILFAIFFGTFWGSLIFNLDRFIVSTFGCGDGKKTISWEELWQGMPRILMAIIIGFVISTPLELKIFEKSINNKLVDIQIEDRKETDYSPFDNEISKYKEDITKLDLQRNTINKDLNDFLIEMVIPAEEEYEDEVSGDAASGVIGHGPRAQAKKEKAERLREDYNNKINEAKSQLTTIVAEIKRNSDRITEIESRKEDARIKNETAMAANNGLLAKLNALNEVTKDNPTLKIAKWLISLLFIMIEVAPILFKMMVEEGVYDKKVALRKETAEIEEKHKKLLVENQLKKAENEAKEIAAKSADNISIRLKILSEKNKLKLEAETKAHKEILDEIASAQSEIAKAAVEEWKKVQLLKIKDEPDEFIKSI